MADGSAASVEGATTIAADRLRSFIERVERLEEDKAAIMDSAIICKFLRGVFSDFFGETAEMLNLVTGWDLTTEELRQIASRIVNAKKNFNISAGWTPAEDTLPPRLLSEKLPDDAQASLSKERLQELVRQYNRLRGWTEVRSLADNSEELCFRFVGRLCLLQRGGVGESLSTNVRPGFGHGGDRCLTVI